MTATAEATSVERRRSPAEPARGSFRSRWRVAGRLARRQVRRTLLSSLLISTLIMLPIAAMTAYAIITISSVPTPRERAAVELGEMQAWLAVKGLPGNGFWQAPTQPDWNGYPSGMVDAPEGEPVDDPLALLPPGTEAIRVVEASRGVITPDGVTGMRTFGGEVWDQRFEGRYELVDGRAPTRPDEALVAPAALRRLGIAIGDEISLADSDDRFTVVGTLTASFLAADTSALFLPDSAAFSGEVRWYLPEHRLNWADVEALNEKGIVAFSRRVVLDPPVISRDEIQGSYDAYWGSMSTLVLLLATAGLFAAYVVVMLAGAAFAVAARRPQRSLAVAASVGATAGDLRRVILLQGTVLGLAGGLTGVALGIGAAAVTMSATTDGSATRFWGFHVPWEILAGILVFSVLVGTASAALPAWTVARSDALGALRGARRPQLPRASRPVWGSVLLAVGITITIGASLAILAVSRTTAPWDSPARTIPPLGIVIGPILVQIGILLSGRWLLWVASKVLSPLGLSARLASRDASANSSRTVPAFAAIAATVFIAVFALGQGAMQTASNARNWFYQAPIDSLAVSFYPSSAIGQTASAIDPAQAGEAASVGLELARGAGASATAVIEQQLGVWWYPSAEAVPDGELRAIAIMPDRHLLDSTTQTSYSSGGGDPQNPISVIPEEQIETALGVDLTDHQLAAYRDGAAVVADQRFVTDGTVTIAAWDARDVYEGRVPDNIWIPTSDAPDRAEPEWRISIKAVMIDAPHQPTLVSISPERAEDLGISTQPSLVIGTFDAPVPLDVRDRVQAHSEAMSGSEWMAVPYFEDGPPDDGFWMIPILTAVAALVLGASAVALSLARIERRPDDATLAAVGATRGLRRRIAFWQGLIIAGFGTLAGTAAGVLPPIGFAIQSGGGLLLADVPWFVLVFLALLLPLGIAMTGWLVRPRQPELTRRTAIT